MTVKNNCIQALKFGKIIVCQISFRLTCFSLVYCRLVWLTVGGKKKENVIFTSENKFPS